MSDPSKRGRSNRINGKQTEKKCEKLLQSWGLVANRVPMSGALKLVGSVTPGLEDKLAGDLKVTINGEQYLIESKRKQNSNTWYKLAENGIVHIEGFCYLLRQDIMHYLVNGGKFEPDVHIKDKGFKALHSFFEQDNADIVTVWQPWHDYLFFLSEATYKKIVGE